MPDHTYTRPMSVEDYRALGLEPPPGAPMPGNSVYDQRAPERTQSAPSKHIQFFAPYVRELPGFKHATEYKNDGKGLRSANFADFKDSSRGLMFTADFNDTNDIRATMRSMVEKGVARDIGHASAIILGVQELSKRL